MSSATVPSWPTMTEYQEAMQAPKVCFADKELRKSKPVTNNLGLPRPVSGQFASVYELESGKSRWAIKCFLRNIPDLHNRYAKIAHHLSTITLPYFVTFDYIDQGVRIRGHLFPIVRMEWVDGLPLNRFIENVLSDRSALEQLEQHWIRLLDDLQSVNVAHADLQHGNVLVATDGSLRLIDYDGMWVPQLDGEGSHEIGHPDYQSPLRTGQDYNAGIDQFAGDVILIALRALARQPELWGKYNTGENMLFRRWDFLEPAKAELFDDLRKLGDDEINVRLEGLIQTCSGTAPRGPSRFFKPRKTKHGPMDATSENVIKAANVPDLAQAPAATRTATPSRRTRAPRNPRMMRGRSAAPAQAAVAVSTTSGTQQAKPVSRPAAATPSAAATGISGGQPLLSLARVIVCLVLLWTVSSAALVELPVLREGARDAATMLLGISFSVAVVLGLASMLSLFGRRPIHLRVHNLFFGLGVLMIMFLIFAELLVSGWSHWTGDEWPQSVLMLSMLLSGALGLVLESAWHHPGRSPGVVNRG